MSFGEDRNKIMKIAEGSRDELDHVYLPLLKADEYVSLQGHTVEQVATIPGPFSCLQRTK